MNFTRNSSYFFRRNTIKSFCQNKFSCNFFNINKFSSKNFMSFTNTFFLTSISKMVITSKSLGMQATGIIMGNSLLNGENSLESSLINIEKLTENSNNINDFILSIKSIVFKYIFIR